jgi:disulfide bond formation protein DsbB
MGNLLFEKYYASCTRAGWQQGRRMCLLLLIVGNGKTTPAALFFQRIF